MRRGLLASLVACLIALGLLAPAESAAATAHSEKRSSKSVCAKLTKKQLKQLRKKLKRKTPTKAQCKRELRRIKNAKKTPQPPVAPQPTRSSNAVFGFSANTEQDFQATENALGIKAGIVGVFTDFTQPFPAFQFERAQARGAALLISWEPHVSTLHQQVQPAYSLDRIIAGDFDAYIAQFARDAAATGQPVYVRWAAEMNGDWHVWSTGFNGNDATDYRDAYRHVVDVARAAGGTNIRWMFNPIVSYEGSTPLDQLYPGDNYVDWIGLDGYNWGSLKPWGWQSFTDIFTMGLTEIRQVAPSKPLAIAEIGSAPGAGKSAWVADTFAKARAAGVRMLVWFEHNKETDWRLGRDVAVSAAASAAIANGNWTTGGNAAAVRAALAD